MALLEVDSVFVHLDPRHENVRVPQWFKKQPRLVLQVGLNMPVPIRDLDVGEQALSCTLSFSRRPHFCYVPWKAVFALVNEQGRGMVWPDDVPPELVAHAQKQNDIARRRASIRAVGSATETPEGSPKAPSRAPSADASVAAGLHKAPVSEPQDEPSRATPEPEASSPASQRPEGGGDSETPSKRGRSLPPYLRVVK